jgi:hypothetical protein
MCTATGVNPIAVDKHIISYINEDIFQRGRGMRSAGNVAHIRHLKINAMYSHTNVEKCHLKKTPRRKNDIKTYGKEKDISLFAVFKQIEAGKSSRVK